MQLSYDPFDIRRIENAYGVAIRKQEAREWSWAIPAMRAARDKSPRMMHALEKCALAMDKWADEQRSDLEAKAEELGHERLEHTESQMFREAYRMAAEDKYDTMEPFLWIYGAVGVLVGITHP